MFAFMLPKFKFITLMLSNVVGMLNGWPPVPEVGHSNTH